MMYSPLLKPATSTSTALVEFLDIYPTVADLAGVDVPSACPTVVQYSVLELIVFLCERDRCGITHLLA
jgi:arylsulfatase A-like enzyme